MTQNLKIEVLTGDISIDGTVVSNLVTKEELSTAIVKKADLGTDGKIPTSQLPAEIVNTAGIVDEVKTELESTIQDAVQEANAYAESYTDNALSSKADLTSGKVPLEQLPAIDQYPQFGTALSNLSTSILTSVKQRTDQLEKTKADLGEDGKVLREQIPSYEKISGLPEQLEVMSTQTAAVSGELGAHKLQTADQIDTLKENIEANVQQLTDRQSHLMRTYVTKELGVDSKVGVKPGEYFCVRSANEEEMLVEYQNIGGVPTPSGKSYPSASYVDKVAEFTALPFSDSKSYKLNERVQLENGDIVKSTVANNTNDPNVDMTNWVKTNDASQIKDKSGRDQQEKNDDVLQVEDYIAISATVRDAFIAALTVLKAGNGGTLNLGRGKSYNIFTSTTGASTNILNFDRLKNVTINFNGSEIVTDSTVQSVPRIFHLKNPKNITFNDVRVRDLAEQAISGTSPPNHWGAQFLRITVDDTVEEADKGGIVINNIEAKHLDAVFLCDGYNGTVWSTKRFKNIAINGRVNILNCYYGAVFQNNGDNFTATLNGENVRRLYYPSGVDGHDAVGTIKGNGLAANAGSTGCIFLKSDDVPLTNITAKFKYIGKLSHANTVALVIQPTTVGIDSQVMENVHVSVDFKEANSGYLPDSIAAFRCYAGGSTVEQTATDHQFKNVTLDLNDPSDGSGVLKTNEFVLFGAQSTKENTISFPRSQPKLRLLTKGHVLKNRGIESRFFYGSLNPATIKIPFDNPFWKTHQLFAKLSITCVNPIGSQRIYREDFYVMGNVTSAGIFQLTSSSKVFTFNSGTSATIALTPNGSSLDVVITGGGGYGDSNCHARVDFELIDATQRRLF